MNKTLLALIFLILLARTAGAEAIIKVEVNESGNAMWTMEKHVPLTSPEFNEWESILNKSQNISRYEDVAEFTDTIALFTSTAQNFSNRSMRVENYSISYDTLKTMSGGFGIIRYEFLWKNFSRTESGNIYIGDAFSEGMVLPSGNMFTIEIPSGYEVENVSPNFDRRDGNTLIWEGTVYQKFKIGEPSLVLSREKVISWDPRPVIVSIVVFISVASIIFWKKRRSGEFKGIEGQIKENESTTVIEENNTGAEIEASPTGIEIQPSTSEIMGDLTPVLSEIDLGDEEMIEKFLIKSGGLAYQSDIVRESGFSKTKISLVLAKMKEDGRIIKIKKGKENVIKLVKK